MNKIKIYRRIGFSLLIIMVIGELVNICQPYKFQRFISNPSVELLPSVWGSMAAIVFNPFLWASILLLWRADVNEQKDKVSIWRNVLIGYISLFLITVLIFVGQMVNTEIQSTKAIDRFKISNITTKNDIRPMILEFGKYPAEQNVIKSLSHEQVDKTINEIYEIVSNDKTRDSFALKRSDVQGEYENYLIQLSKVNFPEDFNSNPSKYPDLVSNVMEFYRQDLKVSIINLIYTATYDKGFKVQWSPEAMAASKTLGLRK